MAMMKAEKSLVEAGPRRASVGNGPSGASSHETDGFGQESCISSGVDLECGGIPHVASSSEEDDEKNCRICHLSLESRDFGVPIVLGCACKDDLAAAHKHCAETWFKIKGNKTCEICGSTAKNVVSVGETELTALYSTETNSIVTVPPTTPTDNRSIWQGRRFLNFLLACMIFAFIISWFFHFNVPAG